jgi:imidazole glycerol-phosphate synthase subunit HisH
MTVGILDYGIGNVGSILSMHRRLMIDAKRVVTSADVEGCDRFILPGVGAFDTAMRALRRYPAFDDVRQRVEHEGAPILGICLGMQMLAEGSEEGDAAERGLGWIAGQVRAMRPMVGPERRLPFMGWAFVEPTRPSQLFDSGGERERFYFVHSYALVPDDPAAVLAVADHGVPVCAAVGRDNVFGTQFHPEKSHRFGMTLLTRFSGIGGGA